MYCTINKLISKSNKLFKLMNGIPNKLKFSPNENISENKYKLIPVML